MARVYGPSRDELDARGDEFAARVERGIRTTLRHVAANARVVDDLARIRTVWQSIATRALVPRLRIAWDTSVEGVRGQLEKINELERETLVAAGFEIPKVSNPLAELFLADAANRLVAIGDHVWYTARGEMLTGMQLGEGVAELRARVIASADVSIPRATTIARTEVNSAMNNGAYEQMKVLDVPTVKEWIATDDARTRESHAEVDGEEIDGDAKFTVGGFPMDHPHDLNAPPSETINCVIGSTQVDTPLIQMAMRSWLDGDVIEIRTSASKTLTVTPNHPVLTTSGWLLASQLKVGDNVMCGNITRQFTGSLHDEQRRPTEIAEVFDSAASFGVAGDRKCVANFHGEWRQAKIRVVAEDRQLGFEVVPARTEEIDKLALAAAYGACACLGSTQRGSLTLDTAGFITQDSACATCGVGVLREASSIVDGSRGVASSVTLGDGACLHFSAEQDISDRAARDVERLADSDHRFTLDVSTDDVISLVVRPYSGHVYNISTTTGWYTGNSIITGNCRCTLAWEIADDEDDYEDELTAAGVYDEAQHPRDSKGKFAKKAGALGKKLKITHMLVHKGHGEPGTILTVNGAGDKRVVWDGKEYRLQTKPPLENKWITEKKVKKSKAYAEISQFDDDWREPDAVTTETPAVAEVSPQKPSAVEAPKVDASTPSVIAPNPVMSQATSTAGYAKVGLKTAANNRFKDENGDEWFIDSYTNANSAKTQVFAAHMYSTLGVKTAQTELVKLDEQNFPNVTKRLGTQKFAVTGITDPSELDNTISFDSHLRKQMWDGFAMDLWLGNKRTSSYEGVTVDQDNNLIRSVDDTFGASSAFGDKVTQDDIDTMRSSLQGTTGGYGAPEAKPSSYVSMPDSHFIEGTRKIASLSSDDIDKLVDDMGFGPLTAKTLKEKLKSRRQSLIDLVQKNHGVQVSGLEDIPDPVPQVGPGASTNATANISAIPDVPDVPDDTPNTSVVGVQPKSMNDLTKTKNHKNGGIFKDKAGKNWFVRPVASESHARNQLLAANLYTFADVHVESTDLVEVDKSKVIPFGGNTVAVKTEYEPGELGLVDSMKKYSKTRDLVNENFAVDAWLGNWDTVGIGYDNITVDQYGIPKRTNLGGSLLYRANGEPKGNAFGDTVTEIDSLRNPHMNAASAKVFADVTDDDIRKGVAKIEKMSPKMIDFIVDQSGFKGDEAALLKKKLKSRRQDLIDKYGSNAPKPPQSSAPAASTQPTASNVLGGTKTFTPSQKAKVQSIFANHNLKWYNKTDKIYNAAQEVSTTHPDLTMGDALDIMDQSLKKKSGNPFRTKVEKFLKTKAGKQHALAQGGSASLGSTTPKVTSTASPTSTPSSSSATKNTSNVADTGGPLPRKLTRTTAGILQQRMNKETPPPWTAEQRAALTKYTGGSYSQINKCARGTAPCDPATKKVLDNINAAMKPSTDNVVVYRKTNASSFGLGSPEEMKNLIGKTIRDDGVISTSIKSNLWTGSLHLEIQAPQGSMLAWVQPISHHPNEDEIVVAPGTHYEVISVSDDPYGVKVKLRIIPGSDTHSRQIKEKAALKKQIDDLKKSKELTSA